MGKAKTIILGLLIPISLLLLFGCTQATGSQSAGGNSTANPLGSFNTQVASGIAKDAKFHVNEGLALFQEGDYAGAKASFERAIATDPKYAPAYFARGQLNQIRMDYNNALKDYNSATSLDPKFTEAYSAKCNLLNIGRFYIESLPVCEKAVVLGSNSPQVFNDLGIAKFKAGDINGSISDFTRSLELGADDPQVYRSRAIAFSQISQYESAASDLRNYLKAVPDDNQTKFYLEQIEMKINGTFISGS